MLSSGWYLHSCYLLIRKRYYFFSNIIIHKCVKKIDLICIFHLWDLLYWFIQPSFWNSLRGQIQVFLCHDIMKDNTWNMLADSKFFSDVILAIVFVTFGDIGWQSLPPFLFVPWDYIGCWKWRRSLYHLFYFLPVIKLATENGGAVSATDWFYLSPAIKLVTEIRGTASATDWFYLSPLITLATENRGAVSATNWFLYNYSLRRN